MKRDSFLEQIGWLGAALGLALLLTVLVALPAGAPPFETIYVLFKGGLSSMSKIGRVFSVWVPLTLCAVGLLLPFTARLWNIGGEGRSEERRVGKECAPMGRFRVSPDHEKKRKTRRL